MPEHRDALLEVEHLKKVYESTTGSVEAIGDISFGGTYVYTAAYRSQTDQNPGSNNGILPATHIVNLNVAWESIAGGPIDAALFVTNLTNEKIFLQANDNETRGFASYYIGQPRMWGVRLKYRFGQ